MLGANEIDIKEGYRQKYEIFVSNYQNTERTEEVRRKLNLFALQTFPSPQRILRVTSNADKESQHIEV